MRPTQGYADRQLAATSVASVEALLHRAEASRMTVGGVVEWTAGKDLLAGMAWRDRTARPPDLAQERSGVGARLLGVDSQDHRRDDTFAGGRTCSRSASACCRPAASQSPREAALGLFLVVAPIGPLVAPAVAFGRWSEPIYE